MIIDRISGDCGGLEDQDAGMMTSPMNLYDFYGNSSPPPEHPGFAGSQSTWSPNCHLETTWGSTCSRSQTGNFLNSVNGELSMTSTKPRGRCQGVRVKNPVKDLIRLKRNIRLATNPVQANEQVQHSEGSDHCSALTTILLGGKRPVANLPSDVSNPKRAASLHDNIQTPCSHSNEDSVPMVTGDTCSAEPYLDITDIIRQMTDATPVSIETVQVQEGPCCRPLCLDGSAPETSAPPQVQELPLYQPTYPSYPLQDMNDPGLPFQSFIPQLDAPCSAGNAVPVEGISFFQWQIQQEEEKLVWLTTERLVVLDKDGDTFLHIAVAQGRRALSFVLAQRMAKIGMLDLKERNDQSPLQVSVAANQHLIVQDLLTLGAQINTADCWGRSPLHVCAEKGHALTLQAIHRTLQGSGQQVNVEAINYEGLTPLHTAVLSHNAVVHELSSAATLRSPVTESLSQKRKLLRECVSTLLLMGASYGNKDLKSGRTALHMAAEEANVELLRLFLDQPDSLSVVNDRAFNGNSALHVASALQGRVAQIDAVKLLLRRGADPSAKNLENEQPGHLVPEGPMGDQVRRILKGKGTPT